MLGFGLTHGAFANTDPIAKEGDPAPVGAGTIAGFSELTVNADGQVGFLARFEGSGVTSDNRDGAYRFNGSTIDRIARDGQLLQGSATLRYEGVSDPILADTGTVSFVSGLASSPFSQGYYRSDSVNTVNFVQEGDSAGFTTGSVDGIDNFVVDPVNGNTAYTVDIEKPDASTTRAVFQDNDLVISEEGADNGAPEASVFGTTIEGVKRYETQDINRFGQVTYEAELDLFDDFREPETVLYKTSPSQDSSLIAQSGDALPNGGFLLSPGTSQIDVNGNVTLDGVTQADTTVDVIIRETGTGTIEVARNGDSGITGIAGTVFDMGPFEANDRGQVFFDGFVEEPDGTVTSTIFRWESDSLAAAAIDGSELRASGDSVDFIILGDINNDGQALVSGIIEGSSGKGVLAVLDPRFGLVEVTREDSMLDGDPLEVITNSALGPDGQVALEYRAPDGVNHLVKWTGLISEQVNNGTFNDALTDWMTAGGGTARIIEDTALDESFVEMVTGSDVSLTQTVDTPVVDFNLAFDYRFQDADGLLEVLLDGQSILSIDAADGTVGSFLEEVILLDEASGLTDLSDTELKFTLSGPTGSTMDLDNISLSPVPEPEHAALIIGAILTGVLAHKRRRRKA
ncbi:MAG: DUF7453 family protein [Opitutales bacterium]